MPDFWEFNGSDKYNKAGWENSIYKSFRYHEGCEGKVWLQRILTIRLQGKSMFFCQEIGHI